MAQAVRTLAVDYGPLRRPLPPTCDPGAWKFERPPGPLGAAAVQPNTVRLQRMGTIDTEDAARRLARVILSDIDLYIRERPKVGESREAQIDQGRRLFASRVTPELVPVFAMILADRAAGTVNAPAAPGARPIAASDSVPAVDPVRSSPVPRPAIDDEPATDPLVVAPSSEDQSRPTSVPVAPPVAAALPPPPLVTRPAPDSPPSIQPARMSIRRMLAIAFVLAVLVAVLHRLFR
jgi:hypothetical protein